MREFSPPRLFFLVLALVVMAVGAVVLRWGTRPDIPRGLDGETSELARQVAAIEATENGVATTIWSREMLAQEYGRVWERLWDELNASTNKLGVLSSFAFDEVVTPQWGAPQSLPYGIDLLKQTGTAAAWTPVAWREFLSQAQRDGWQMERAEFRHLQFDPGAAGQPARSRWYASGHFRNVARTERAIVEGELLVDWGDKDRAVRRIEPRSLTIRKRQGEPGFREVLHETLTPPPGSYFIDPLILYDLDADGVSEIILAAKNAVYRWEKDGSFSTLPLCRFPPGLIFTGMIADFDGDGVADFLCAKFEGLLLFRGSTSGRFEEAGLLVWTAEPRLRYGQALACGDIDGDGDLDVWLGQYKVPYDRGQMPTPYYDALDGHPSFLLMNDGHGSFHDGTVAAGLAEKRFRRAYSGAFLDANRDGHLDLAIASDFAGLELFMNDGHGRFSDRTSLLRPDWHGFGMSLISADFNQDARPELLMIGMNVPVAERLQHAGLARPGFEQYVAMSGPMGYGNRLFVAEEGGFAQAQLGESIARSGWSWGASSLDFDNDSYPDLYIANGHESKESVREYEPEFWLHDIYVGTSRDNLAAFAYFRSKSARTRGSGMSYGGYEKNRLFWNQQGREFIEIGHLMGVGLEEDSRNVVADDFDRDGRMDLVVTTFEVWPRAQQTLRVFRNQLPTAGHWIGFTFREEGQGRSPAGARVTIRCGQRQLVQDVVAGDSYRSQKANFVHFGLGALSRVDSVEVRWNNGQKLVLNAPAIDCYHAIQFPSAVGQNEHGQRSVDGTTVKLATQGAQ